MWVRCVRCAAIYSACLYIILCHMTALVSGKENAPGGAPGEYQYCVAGLTDYMIKMAPSDNISSCNEKCDAHPECKGFIAFKSTNKHTEEEAWYCQLAIKSFRSQVWL